MIQVRDEVRREVVRLFAAEDVERVLRALAEMSRPLASSPEWSRERARVQMAVIMLSAGDADRLLGEVARAEVDWRDTLCAAGLENDDWPEVLRRAGFEVS